MMIINVRLMDGEVDRRRMAMDDKKIIFSGSFSVIFGCFLAKKSAGRTTDNGINIILLTVTRLK